MISIEKIKSIALFKDLSDAYITQCAQVLKEIHFTPGQTIFLEGSTGTALYIIVSGSVHIQKEIDQASHRFKTLAVFEKSDYFGEMSLLEDKPRSASAYAHDDVEVLVLEREDFNRLLQSSPNTAVDQLFRLLKGISDRLRHTSVELTTLYELGQVLINLDNPKTICSAAIDKIYSVFEGYGAAWIMLWNEFNEEYDMVCKTGALLPISLPDTVPAQHPFIAYAQTSPAGLLSNNISSDIGIGTSIHKLIIVPLWKKPGISMGYICVARTAPEDDFRNSDYILLSAVGSFTSTAVINAYHIQEEIQRARLQQRKDAW